MLRVLTFNSGLSEVRLFGLPFYTDVPHVNERAAQLAAALRSVDADIVALQELLPVRVKKRLAAELSDQYPHAAGIAEDGRLFGAGLLILSRYPIDAPSYTAFARQTIEEGLFGQRGLVGCTVHTPSLGPCRVANLHATAGGALRKRRRGQDCRHAQVTQAAAIARDSDEPIVILTGDFNTGPTAAPHIYERLIEAGFEDAVVVADEPNDAAVRGTWDPQNVLNEPKVANLLRKTNGNGRADGHRAGNGHIGANGNGASNGHHAISRGHRVDHVFLRRRSEARVRVNRTHIVLDEPVVALPGGASVPVSDHYGLLVELVTD